MSKSICVLGSIFLLVTGILGMARDANSDQEPPPAQRPAGEQAQSQSEQRARTGQKTGDDDDIDDLIVERGADEQTADARRKDTGGGSGTPADAPAPPKIPKFRPGKGLRDTANSAAAPARLNCGTFWTGWVDNPNPDKNPCPANCVRGERLQDKQYSQGATAQYDVQYQCYMDEGPTRERGQTSAAVEQPPAGSVSPVSGPWHSGARVTGPGIADAAFIRTLWYPNDDATQPASGSITATVTKRTPPDGVEIQIPNGAGGAIGGVIRIVAVPRAGGDPVFLARYTIGDSVTPARLAPRDNLGTRPATAQAPTPTVVPPRPAGVIGSTTSSTPPTPPTNSGVKPPPTLNTALFPTLPGAPKQADASADPVPPPAGLAPPAALAGARGAVEGSIKDKVSAPGPTLTSISNITPYSVTANWSGVEGASRYQVFAMERGVNQAIEGPVVGASGSQPSMSAAIEGLTSGFTYDVWVRAEYADGRQGVSEIKPATLQTAVNPANFRAKASGDRSVELTWDMTPGAVRYIIEGSNLPRREVTQPPFFVAELPFGTHEWIVIAVYGKGVYNDLQPSRASLTVETREALVERAFNAGQANYPDGGPDPARWKKLALGTTMGYDELVKAFPAIWVITQAYQHLLNREATPAEAANHLEPLINGKSWKLVWREIAHSPERDQRFGHWAPAPIDDIGMARIAFNQPTLKNGQACYGGLGDGCDSDIVGDPTWSNGFALPDGTRMAFVEINVAVGSILHDNRCLQNSNGLHCDNQPWHWVAERLPVPIIAFVISPAAIEWNKASWNVMDGRKWRERFGPYPVDPNLRRASWYDDLRPTAARVAWMAPVFATLTIPVHTERYSGAETRRTRALVAPTGTSLDAKDAQFCKSGAFSKVEGFIGKADWGFCR